MAQRSPLLMPNNLAGKKELLKELNKRKVNLETNKTAANEADIYQIGEFIKMLEKSIQKDEEAVRESMRIHAN